MLKALQPSRAFAAVYVTFFMPHRQPVQALRLPVGWRGLRARWGSGVQTPGFEDNISTEVVGMASLPEETCLDAGVWSTPGWR
jgi:hypothetical protein